MYIFFFTLLWFHSIWLDFGHEWLSELRPLLFELEYYFFFFQKTNSTKDTSSLQLYNLIFFLFAVFAQVWSTKIFWFFSPWTATLSLSPYSHANTLKIQEHALLRINYLSMSITFVSADFKYTVLCMWSGGNPILKLLWLIRTIQYNCQVIYSQLMYKSWKQKAGE